MPQLATTTGVEMRATVTYLDGHGAPVAVSLGFTLPAGGLLQRVEVAAAGSTVLSLPFGMVDDDDAQEADDGKLHLCQIDGPAGQDCWHFDNHDGPHSWDQS